MDPDDGYAILSGFKVTSGGVPAIAGRGVSLEADCAGHLWTYDVFNNVVYEYESGEPRLVRQRHPVALAKIRRRARFPAPAAARARRASGNTLPVTVTFDSNGRPSGPVPALARLHDGHARPGRAGAGRLHGPLQRRAAGQLRLELHLRRGGRRRHAGLHPHAPLYAFCPAEVVTRRSMAGYIERAVHGALAPPPVYIAEFDDVLLGSFNADYIQGLVDDGITAGCGVGGNYCPDVPVTRAQMAVFVWKGQHGDEAPPACTPPGTFADVPCPGGFAVDYVEGIDAEGDHGRMRQRELLPEREHHERADGGVPGEGVRHSVPAVASGFGRAGGLRAARYSALGVQTFPSFTTRRCECEQTRRRCGRSAACCAPWVSAVVPA